MSEPMTEFLYYPKHMNILAFSVLFQVSEIGYFSALELLEAYSCI